MSFHLVFIQDSGRYRKGEHIADPAVVKDILGTEQEAHVVKVFADDPPAVPAVVTPPPVAFAKEPPAFGE